MHIKANEVKVGDIIQMRSTRSPSVRREVWEVITVYGSYQGRDSFVTSDGITRRFPSDHEFWLINSTDRLVPVDDMGWPNEEDW